MKQCLVLLVAIFPTAALSQNNFGPLRYDYVSASLVVPELDELGIEIGGSTAVTEEFIVFGRYRDFEPGNRVEIESLQIGVGHIWNIRPSIDFVATLSYADNEIDPPGLSSIDEEGLIVGAHVLGWATGKIELGASVMLDNSTGSSTDTVLELGAQYFQGANWSYGGRVRNDDDDTTLFLGVRLYFGASRRPAR